MHMIQHLLIIAIAAPLLWLADPFPFSMWGLPAGLRREVGRLLARDSLLRQLLRTISQPGVVWMTFVIILIGWHDPNMYDAALIHPVVHDIEHLTFFFAAMLYWWQVVGAAPHVRRRLSRGVRLGLLLAMVPPMAITGIVIALSTNPIYPYYTTRPRLWGLSAVQDQMISGIIMWIPGSMMYILGALLLIYKMLGREEEKKPLPEAAWAGDDAMTRAAAAANSGRTKERMGPPRRLVTERRRACRPPGGRAGNAVRPARPAMRMSSTRGA
jgi:cytochrome c oxidase assembly factor CtaG